MALSDVAAKRGGKIPLILFLSLFSLFGAVFFFFFFVRPVVKVVAARSWPELDCRILSSQVGVHSGSEGGSTYSIDIAFEYEWRNEKYRSDRYDFMGGSSSGRSGKEEVVSRHPAGSKALCYVNPGDPSEAVLDRGFRPVMLVGLVPLLFVAAGAVGIYFTLRRPRPKRAPEAPDGDEPELPGAVVLKPETSRGCRLAGALAICLFWNGIVSIFVVEFVQSWQRGSPEGCMGLFLVPFVLIGLLLIWLVLYTVLSMFNPVPQIRIGAGSVPIGGVLDLEWEFQGAYHRLRALRITLEGREEATYRRGTKTSTDKHTFSKTTIYEAGLEGDLRGGRALVPIARDAMPSFKAPSNKIVWAIHLHGEIACWPDVKEEFPLNLTPLPEGERA